MSNKTFESFNLPPVLLASLTKRGFMEATEVQTAAIPSALAGRDVLASAQTGSGKTLAFLIPIYCQLIEDKDSAGLVLVPTRELAGQVADEWKKIAGTTPGFGYSLIIGGESMGKQIQSLRCRPRLIIATPGRLLDHLRRKTANLRNTGILVLDEADRMLDMGFAPQIREVLKVLPEARQTMLFSATFPKEMKAIVRYLVDPVQVRLVKKETAPSEITQEKIAIKGDRKNEHMLDLVNAKTGSMLAFVRTQRRADRLAQYLNKYGLNVACIHGGKGQGQRTQALKSFRDGKARIMVATDIAARGLDIDHVAHVVNYDLPQTVDDYVHRIGRTGRAGRAGAAYTFVAMQEEREWRLIESQMRRH